MIRKTKKDISLSKIQMPKWMVGWAQQNPGESRLLFLIFSSSNTVDSYFNSRYPENFWDYQQSFLDFKFYNFRKEGWETYRTICTKLEVSEQMKKYKNSRKW